MTKLMRLGGARGMTITALSGRQPERHVHHPAVRPLRTADAGAQPHHPRARQHDHAHARQGKGGELTRGR